MTLCNNDFVKVDCDIRARVGFARGEPEGNVQDKLFYHHEASERSLAVAGFDTGIPFPPRRNGPAPTRYRNRIPQ